jgi:hypothetical protein
MYYFRTIGTTKSNCNTVALAVQTLPTSSALQSNIYGGLRPKWAFLRKQHQEAMHSNRVSFSNEQLPA